MARHRHDAGRHISYSVPGRFFPYDITGTEEDFVMQLGHHVTVTPAVGRAGESLNVRVSGLPLSTAEVWVVPANSLGYDFGGEWDFTTDSATSLGSVPVVGGAVNASVEMPSGLSPDGYAVLVGEPGGDWVPAGPSLSTDGGGTFANLTIEAGDPRTLTPTWRVRRRAAGSERRPAGVVQLPDEYGRRDHRR